MQIDKRQPASQASSPQYTTYFLFSCIKNRWLEQNLQAKIICKKNHFCNDLFKRTQALHLSPPWILLREQKSTAKIWIWRNRACLDLKFGITRSFRFDAQIYIWKRARLRGIGYIKLQLELLRQLWWDKSEILRANSRKS